jgi:hypothetical protein
MGRRGVCPGTRQRLKPPPRVDGRLPSAEFRQVRFEAVVRRVRTEIVV